MYHMIWSSDLFNVIIIGKNGEVLYLYMLTCLGGTDGGSSSKVPSLKGLRWFWYVALERNDLFPVILFCLYILIPINGVNVSSGSAKGGATSI